jgi:hypothetical protein
MATLQQSIINGFRFGRTAGNQQFTAAFGRYAGNSTNNYATLVGYRSGINNTSYSAFAGARAGESNYNVSNVGIGFCAFNGSGARYESTAVGQRAQRASTSGRANVAIGSFAFDGGSTHVQSVGLGINAGRCSNSDNAVFIGLDTGCNTTGTENVLLGARAGRCNTGGAQNFMLGAYAGYPQNLNRTAVVGRNTCVSGNCHIVWGGPSNNQGNCTFGGWSYISDARDKTDIQQLTCKTGLQFIKKLRPVSYNLDIRENYVNDCNFPFGQKDGTLAVATKDYGFVAQEVKAILEELEITDFSALGYTESQDAYRLTYAEFLAPLTKAIQELDIRTQALKVKVGI